MDPNLLKLKDILKLDVALIRRAKSQMKERQRLYNDASMIQKGVEHMRKENRHTHIAYSMMRGRKYEEIEQKVRKGNESDMSLVYFIIQQITSKVMAAKPAEKTEEVETNAAVG